MRAAVLEEIGRLTIRDDVTLEPPRVGEVRVRIAHCGVCHSDLSLIDGDLPPFLPVILGHEAAGEVVEVGLGVTNVREGDRVVLTSCPPCGGCYWCVRGEWSLCVRSDAISTSTMPDGSTRLARGGELVWRGVGMAAFADEVVVAAEAAIPVADDVPLGVACVLGCAVQTGVGAVLNTARVEEGATVLVFGAGGVGLSVVQGAALAAATTVVVVDPVADRRAVAERLGATHTIDPGDTDVVTAVRDLTGGIGVDYAFEAVGRSALVNTAVDATRNGGTTVMVGVPRLDDPLTLGSATLFTAQAKRLVGTLLGGVNSRREIPRLLALWQAGRLDLDSLVTGHRPLTEINEAVDDLRHARGVRTVLDM